MAEHTRKSHFLGAKLRGLRKRNGLTLEEPSARCIQIDSHSVDMDEIVANIADACLHRHGQAPIPRPAAQAIREVSKVLNIAWIEDALSSPARIICPRSTHCPRTEHCDGERASRAREITDVRKEIISSATRGR